MNDVILNGVNIKDEISNEIKALEISVSDEITVEEVSMKAEVGVGVFVSDTITSRDKPHA